MADANEDLEDSNGKNEKDYSEMFKTRYTEADVSYAKINDAVDVPPPCVFPWYNRPKRSFDYTQFNKKRPYEDDRSRNDGNGEKRFHDDRDRGGYGRGNYGNRGGYGRDNERNRGGYGRGNDHNRGGYGRDNDHNRGGYGRDNDRRDNSSYASYAGYNRR